MKKKNDAKRTTDSNNDAPKSVIFTATFGERHRATICADTCSDDNILDRYMLQAFKKAGVEHTVEELPRPRTFNMAAHLPNGKPAPLTCRQVVTADTELHIRHGSALILRGVRWLVTDQAVGDPLLGRPLLEALGPNTRDILAAAAEKHAGVVDVSALVGTDPANAPSGRVARILEGVYHADGAADDADLEEEDEDEADLQEGAEESMALVEGLHGSGWSKTRRST